MNIPCSFFWHVLAAGLVATSTCIGDADSATVKQLFAKPSRDFSSGPLWVWNDMLTEAQIRETMRDLAGQQVKQVFVHPRPGLMTPYLGEDWFRLWKIALDEAERLDMNVWIYDENSYPSGFAGGWVPELMPESRGRGLHFSTVKNAPKWNDKTLAVFRITDRQAENVSQQAKAGEELEAGSYLVGEVRRAANSPWNGNRCYVDLLYPGVTEKFLEVTHEAYRREIGQHFGKRVPGAFTDEPELRPAGGFSWTDDLPQQFEKRWGYSLIDNLASLARPVGDWQRVRYNYYRTLNELFIERWAKPYGEYCEKHHLEMTGHYWEHEWPNAGVVPDNMAMYAWQQRPAIDCLMNQYAENTHAQFGNARAVRELNSIANQLGKKRTLCELYGAAGWDLRFEDMKRIADWLGVLGVNTFDQHVSYVTIRGARKRDHPQSFSYHEPWWDSYHVSAAYLERLTVAVSQGEQVNRILVIEPTTTAWMYQGDGSKLGPLGDSFFKLIMGLEAAQVEYDLGCEDVIGRHGSIEGKLFRVGQRGYHVVVLPPLNENIDAATAKLLRDFSGAGGSIVRCGDLPSRVDGAASPALQNLVTTPATTDELPRVLRKWNDPSFSIARAPEDRGILFHMRRQLVDGELLLLVNTSIDAPTAGEISSSARGVERWDLESGKVAEYAFKASGSGVRANYRLPPSGSLLLWLSKKAIQPLAQPAERSATVAALGGVQVRRLEPNVLTLDYVDVTAGSETKRDVYFYEASQFVWEKNGVARNPWDSAVQFKDELITKKFPAGSGFEASYKFTIESAVPTNLTMVIERPDLYSITCNGQSVSANPGEWWLDKAFGRISIAKCARVGENVVTIKASSFTQFHELESAYVLGDFTLKAESKGFVIAHDQPLRVSATEPILAHGINPGNKSGIGWNDQGHPFYSAGVAYGLRFDISNTGARYVVHLPSWYGSVAKVLVNGTLAGHIVAPPWDCDVTPALKRGENTIEVVVIGTLKNTLGPHHGNPVLGAAWPGNFQRGPIPGPPPGAQYSTVSYGMFAPFELKQVKAGTNLATIRVHGGRPAAAIEVAKDPASGQLDITEAGRPVLRYNYVTIEPGERLSQIHSNNLKYARARSDYIHPLYGLDGEELTKDWPVDHPHHRGIYWAWPEVQYGRELGDLHALQRVFARPTGNCAWQSGNDYAQIDAENVWLWEDNEAIVRERATIRAYRSNEQGRNIDLRFEFTALEDGVTVARRGTDKYGGLNIRLEPVANQQITFRTDPVESQFRMAWAELSGVWPGGKGPLSLAILQKRTNPDYPGDWIKFPEINWVQPTFPAAETRFALKKDRPLVLEFRLWIRRGDKPSDESYAAQWMDFNHVKQESDQAP